MQGFNRNEVVTLVNKSTGLKTFGRVQGAAGENKLEHTFEVKAAYDLLQQVQYSRKDEDVLEVRKTTGLERFKYKFNSSNYAYHGYFVGLAGVAIAVISNFA